MKYKTTAQILEEYQISDSTLRRWREDQSNPFPNPYYSGGHGKQSLYVVADIEAWEDKGGMKSLSHQIAKRKHAHAN